jgi:hypothetical protein
VTFDYRTWRIRNRLTHAAAAAYLGISIRSSKNWSRPDVRIRQAAIIACNALEAQKEGDRAD